MKRNNLLAVALLGIAACLGACATRDPVKDVAAERQSGAEVSRLIVEKNWPQAQIAVQAMIASKAFGSIPGDLQYKTLWDAAVLGITHGDRQIACRCARRL
jgi:hypothetical protein